jgi:hypothetical protein
MALMPTERMGPPPGAPPPMRMTASWSGSKRTYRIQVRGARSAPNGELPSDYTQTGTARRRSYQEEAALLRVILPPRAQPSRRCETQAPLSGKPPSCAKCFGPLTASARSGNLIAGDATKNGPFPLRTKNQQKPKTNSLTGEAPYKFESISLQRGVWYELDFSGVQEDWQAPAGAHAPITRGTERRYGAGGETSYQGVKK